MLPHHNQCFFVIVHHGSARPTRALVRSLLTNSRVPDRIIVIDHSHPHPPLAFPKETSSALRVIRPPANDGYGAGLMMGLGALLKVSPNPSQDLVCCLNNDVTLSPDTVSRLINWWQQSSRPAVAGLRRGHVNLFTGRAHLDTRHTRGVGGESAYKLTAISYKLEYLHGAALAGTLVNLARHLPTDYFLYSEDVAMSWRARRHGLNLAVLPAKIGLRHDDTPEPVADQKLYYLVRNGARVLEEEAPRPWQMYWRLANTLRRHYHVRRHHHTVARALTDARHHAS